MDKTREIITLLGKQGYGKSHFAKKFQIPRFLKTQPVIVMDTMNEYSDGVCIPAEKIAEYVIRNGLPRKKPLIAKITSEHGSNEAFRVSRYCGVPHALVVEESDKYMGSAPGSVHPVLSDLINYGRHFGISLLFIARRAAAISRNATSQTDFFISFSQHENADLEALSKYYDGAKMLRQIPKRVFLAFGDVPNYISRNQTPGAFTVDASGKVKNFKLP